METTRIAGTAGGLTIEQWFARTRKALELFRVDATLRELQDTRSPNARLIAWYEGRRELLAKELGI